MAKHTFTVTAPEIDQTQLAAIADTLRLDVARRVFAGSEVTVKVGDYENVDPMAEYERNTSSTVQAAAEDEARAQLDVAPSKPAEKPVRQKKHSLPEDVAKVEAARQAKVIKRAGQAPRTPESGKQAQREADHADASKKGGDPKKAVKNPAPKDEVVTPPKAAPTPPPDAKPDVPPHQVTEG